MNFDNKLRKRLISFSVFPLFSIVNLVTEDIVIRSISIGIIVLWAGIFIFVRDRKLEEEEQEVITPIQPETILSKPTIKRNSEYFTGLDESIKIISKSNEEETKEESKEEVKTESVKTEGIKTTAAPIEDNYLKKPKDLKQRFDKLAKSEYPNKLDNNGQFLFVIESVLEIIKNIYNLNSVIFFWYNQKTEKFTVGKFLSEVTDAIITEKFVKEDDVLGKIVNNESPEILINIPSRTEKDNIRYYKTPQEIKCFVGVPVFYNKILVGVLAIDSKEENAFKIEHIYSLGRFSRLLSMLIWLFEEMSRDTQADKRLNALLNVINGNLKFKDEYELGELLISSGRNLIESEVVTFVYYYSKKNKFIVTKVWNSINAEYVAEGTEVELSNTLVGLVVNNVFPIKIDDVEEKPVIKFNKNERISCKGSFIVSPLVYENEIYGILCFEHSKKKFYNNSDLTILKNTLKFYGFILQSYYTETSLTDMLTVDKETGILNNKEFFNNTKNMIELSKSLKINSALLLIHIDDLPESEGIFEENLTRNSVLAVVKLINEDLPKNAIFGRLDEKEFGIFLINMEQNSAFSFAELIRSKIARNSSEILKTQHIVTISVGVAITLQEKTLEDLLLDAELALKKAIEKGGNVTKIV